MKLTPREKQINADYFRGIINSSAQLYMWQDLGEYFVLKNGKLQGTERGVSACKEITPLSFHKNFEVLKERKAKK